MKHYLIDYTLTTSLKDVFPLVKKRIMDVERYDGIINFLNEQEAYYAVHFPLSNNKKITMIYITVEEEYMNMFYIKTGNKFPESSNAIINILFAH